MRGETSLTSEKAARDKFAPKLAARGESAGVVADELFEITGVLDDTPRLKRALTDPARNTPDKVALVDELWGKTADPLTVEILEDLVGRRWSRVGHIANATEDLALDARLYQADARGVTRTVAIELAKIRSATLGMSVLRSLLSDEHKTPEQRVALITGLFDQDTLDPITLSLAQQGTRNLRNRRYGYTLQWYVRRISEHCGDTVVTVTSAVELSSAQIKRIVAIYTRKLGRPVYVNSIVDPTVIGGVRIQYGAVVVDNTVAAKLHSLREQAVAA